MAAKRPPEGDAGAGSASLADLIFAADDLPREAVPTPEWANVDGKLYVQGMTGTDRDALDALAMRADVPNWTLMDNAMAHVLVRTVVHEDGQRVFTAKQVDDLGKKSGAVLLRLFRAAIRLSAATAAEATEVLDDLKDDPSDGSGTD